MFHTSKGLVGFQGGETCHTPFVFPIVWDCHWNAYTESWVNPPLLRWFVAVALPLHPHPKNDSADHSKVKFAIEHHVALNVATQRPQTEEEGESSEVKKDKERQPGAPPEEVLVDESEEMPPPPARTAAKKVRVKPGGKPSTGGKRTSSCHWVTS